MRVLRVCVCVCVCACVRVRACVRAYARARVLSTTKNRYVKQRLSKVALGHDYTWKPFLFQIENYKNQTALLKFTSLDFYLARLAVTPLPPPPTALGDLTIEAEEEGEEEFHA